MANIRAKMNYCPICGKLYAVNPTKMCERCFFKEQEKIKVAQEYMKKNPDATLTDVVEYAKLHKATVKYMKNAGLLPEDMEEEVVHPCKGCGKPISRGTLCEACAAGIHSEINRAQAQYDLDNPEQAEKRKQAQEEKEAYYQKIGNAFKKMGTKKKEEAKLAALPEASVDDFQKLATSLMTQVAMAKSKKKFNKE